MCLYVQSSCCLKSVTYYVHVMMHTVVQYCLYLLVERDLTSLHNSVCLCVCVQLPVVCLYEPVDSTSSHTVTN